MIPVDAVAEVEAAVAAANSSSIANSISGRWTTAQLGGLSVGVDARLKTV